MKIIFTDHAKKRIIERDIKIVEVQEAINSPDYIVNKNNKFEANKKINEKILKVIYIEKNKFIKVITVIKR